MEYAEGKTFKKMDYTAEALPKGEYEDCRFIDCEFSGSDLSEVKFVDCSFENSNLSLATLSGTVFRDVHFKDCKMLGMYFEHCNPFGLSMGFENCLLNNTSFYEIKIKRTVFKNCSLQETDFAECDLTGAVFENCDLAGAQFDHTILEKADLRTATNYSIHPESNRIKKAKFSLPGITGLLDQYDIEITA